MKPSAAVAAKVKEPRHETRSPSMASPDTLRPRNPTDSAAVAAVDEAVAAAAVRAAVAVEAAATMAVATDDAARRERRLWQRAHRSLISFWAGKEQRVTNRSRLVKDHEFLTRKWPFWEVFFHETKRVTKIY